MDALGPDFVDRLWPGDAPLGRETEPERRPDESEVALAGGGTDAASTAPRPLTMPPPRNWGTGTGDHRGRDGESVRKVEVIPPVDIEALARNISSPLTCGGSRSTLSRSPDRRGSSSPPAGTGRSSTPAFKFLRSEKTFILFYKEANTGRPRGGSGLRSGTSWGTSTSRTTGRTCSTGKATTR